MTLRVIGAGWPRTGTSSLKMALERLLGGTCFHMHEFFHRPQDDVVWRAAAGGDRSGALDLLTSGFTATVDTPACLLWRELADMRPDAIVLLSSRRTAQEWWDSADATVMRSFRSVRSLAGGVPAYLADEPPAHQAAILAVYGWIDRDLWGARSDATAAMAAYDAWLTDVRATAPADRLLEWQPGDGWDPLCAALGVAVPDEPFPRTNTRAEFMARNRKA